MCESLISKEEQERISKLFKTMDDSPCKDSYKLAKDWLETHNYTFTGFFRNKFMPADRAPLEYAIGPFSVKICDCDDKQALKDTYQNLDKLKESWFNITTYERSQYLYRVAETIEKNLELCAQVLSVLREVPVYKEKYHVLNLVQSFKYYAGMAGNPKFFTEEKVKGHRFITNVVCVASRNEALFTDSVWKVPSILATGNAILLSSNNTFGVFAFLLAELCQLSGLPADVFNVLPACGERDPLLLFEDVKSSMCVVSDMSAIPCEVFASQTPVVIVHENSDLHSAAKSVLEMVSLPKHANQGSLVYVQASAKEEFYKIIEKQLPVPKTPELCSCFDVRQFLEEARPHFKVYNFKETGIDEKEYVCVCSTPSIVYDVPTTSKLLEKLPVSSVIVTVPFRTVKESIAMVNHSKLGSAVSLWTEKLPVAMEMSRKLRTRTVWINCQGVYDPAVSYGGLGRSGSSVYGGTEGFFTSFNLGTKSSSDTIEQYGITTPEGISFKSDLNIKQNYELHIGGSYKKPTDGKYTIVMNRDSPFAYVGLGSSADVQASIASAVAVQSKWENLGKSKRLQILRKAASITLSKQNEFLSILKNTSAENEKEMEDSLSLFRLWANDTNYSAGGLIETETCAKVIQERYPLGVIGIQVSDDRPLLSFVSTVIPAIAYGNAVVVVAKNDLSAIPALKMCEILQSSGILGGIANVITGNQANLTRHLALNGNLDSVWHSHDGSASFLHHTCATHPKRVFDCKSAASAEKVLVSEATYLKSILMPAGSIFAH